MCANFLLIYGSFCSGRTFLPPLPFRTTKASFWKEEGEEDTFPFLLPPLLALCASPFSPFLLLWNVRCPRPPSYFWVGFGWRRRDFFSFLSDARKKGGGRTNAEGKMSAFTNFFSPCQNVEGVRYFPLANFLPPVHLPTSFFPPSLLLRIIPLSNQLQREYRRQLPAAHVFAQK